MNSNKLLYRVCLSIFSMAMLGTVLNSIINYDTVVETIMNLGYPPYLVHLLGTAQVFGIVLLIFNKGQWFIEWVYAGFFLNLTLGFIAHLVSDYGNGAVAVFCLIPLVVTYIQYKKLESTEEAQNSKKTFVWHRV